MRRRAASICRCFRASFLTLSNHPSVGVWLKTAHVFKFHFKLRRRLAGCTWMLSSVRERALLVEANGYMELSADLMLTKPTMLMAELHDESRMNFSRDVLTLNFGLRHEFTENYILIVSMGHELRSPDQPTALIGYFGMQFVY